MIQRFKLPQILKIILASLFIALVIVFSKFIPISNIFGLPFLRISLGPTLIIFASLLLGPIYGSMVGVLSDLVGFLFDSTGYSYNPLFSLTYLMYGLIPGLLVYLLIKNKSKFPLVQSLIFIFINIFIIVFLLNNNSISPYGGKVYELTFNTKIIIIVSMLVITILYFVIHGIIYKKLKSDDKRIVLNNISIINFITLVFVQLFIGVIVKYITYQVDIVVLIASQIVVTTIEIFISNYLNTTLYIISKKFFKKYLLSSRIEITTSKNRYKIKKSQFKRVIHEELSK